MPLWGAQSGSSGYALTEKERSRLQSARPFISEDCERLSIEDVLERLENVAASGDKVAKILHVRYGRFRLETLEEEADRLARERRTDPQASKRAHAIRLLTETLSALEEDLQNRSRAERAQKLTEAAARWHVTPSGGSRRLMAPTRPHAPPPSSGDTQGSLACSRPTDRRLQT